MLPRVLRFMRACAFSACARRIQWRPNAVFACGFGPLCMYDLRVRVRLCSTPLEGLDYDLNWPHVGKTAHDRQLGPEDPRCFDSLCCVLTLCAAAA